MTTVTNRVSFSIPIAEGFKTIDAGKNTIRIRGVALKGDIVSRNNRMYVAKELAKACNTWIGKPVNVNHNNNMNVGHITFMDYENDLLTYEAEINKQPYVNLLRSKSTEIKGVSIQADYLFNRCIKCGEKFYDEPSFHAHMNREHFIKTDPATTPHGIIGSGLALVLSPEAPGYSGTSVELSEVWRIKTLQLLETVIKEEKEKEKMKEVLNGKAVLTPNSSYTITRAKENVIEKPKAETASPTQAPATQEPQAPTKPTTTPITITPPTQHVASMPQVTLTEIQKPTLKTITLTETAETEQVTVKPEGKIAPLTETKTKLSLGEPFAGYDSFEACVAANSDKENPEAYCGEIKHKAEEYMVTQKQIANLTAKLNELITAVNTPLTTPKVNESWRTQTSQLKEAVEQLQSEVGKLPEQFNNALKTLMEAINSLPQDDLGWRELKIPEPYNDAPIKEAIANIKPYDDKPLTEKLTATETKTTSLETETKTLHETLEKLQSTLDKTLTEKLDQTIQKTEQLETTYKTDLTKLSETIQKQAEDNLKVKETFEKLLTQADKNITEVKKTLETREKELLETKNKLQETEKLTIRVDNLENKLTPEFRGKTQKVTTPTDKPYVETPSKGAN